MSNNPGLTVEIPPLPDNELVKNCDCDEIPCANENCDSKTKESNENTVLTDSTNSLLTQNEPLSKEKAVTQDIKKLSFFMALLIETSDADAIDKYNLRISKQMKKIIQTLLSVRTGVNSTVFDNIENIFREIIADDKIDAKDVPKVMLLIAELYQMSHKTEFKFDEKACGDILKIMFLVATKEKIIPVSDENIQLLTCLYEIIDMSVRLTQAKDGDTASAPGLFACLYERATSCIKCIKK